MFVVYKIGHIAAKYDILIELFLCAFINSYRIRSPFVWAIPCSNQL